MKLEHRSEQVVPFSDFLIRLGQYLLFSFALIFLSLGIGVAGYHHYGDLTLVDSVHMASMILTGMGPVIEMKTASAKIFSSCYALYSGMAFLSITGVFLTPIIHRLLHILHVERSRE